MQYQLAIFESEDHGQFRTLEIDGEPWFVLSDACRALAIRNASDAANRLDDDEKGIAQIDTLGGPQSKLIINETGLYSLILRSDKPEAKRFKKWITSEVLPSIRKTGGYKGSAQPVPAIWQPFHDRIELAWGAVPDGYFSVFKEMADLMATLITAGVTVDHRFIPDISVGQIWGKYWEEKALHEDYGSRVSYKHNYPASYPQSRSNPQDAWAYPDEALSTFRRWARNVYFKQQLPGYLARKVKQGELPPGFTDAVLTAIGVETAPKPRLPPFPR